MPKLIREKPVLKMVSGKNIHGHTAPFPDALPALLINVMQRGETILDPFAGSLTTGRVAERAGIRSVLIERNPDYCDLGLRMRKQDVLPGTLSFDFGSA